MNSPVAKNGKHRQKKKGDICPVCVNPIVDSAKGKRGQDAVFCDGACKSWLYHQCAGLSKTAFAALPGPDVEFFALIVAYLNMKYCYLS